MKIRTFVNEENDFEDYKSLLAYCFGVDPESLQFELDHMFKDKDTMILGAYEDDKLKSSLIIYDFNIFWHKSSVRMGGIGAVTSFPEARQSHLVEELLRLSLEKMCDLKMMFSLLGPFSYSFYRKYGWEWGMSQFKYEINIMDLKHFKSGHYRTRPVTEDDIESLMCVYTASYSRHNGPLDRSKSQWSIKFAQYKKDKTYTYGVLNQSNQLVGYITYDLKDRTFIIKELGYMSLDVKKHLFYFIFVHRAQVDTLKMNLPESDSFLSMLENPRQKTTLSPGMMVRVIDVKQVLLALTYPSGEPVEFSIKIDDAYAP